MYSLAQWKRITKRLVTEAYPGEEHPSLSLRDWIEIKAGNEVLKESKLFVIREILQEALYDLDVANQTISLVHTVRGLLAQTIRDNDITHAAPQCGSTPGSLLILWHTRTERVRMLRAALAPHKRLPPEILAEIFKVACNDHALSLPPNILSPRWTISQVCARWRQVALNEPRLWNNILIERYSPSCRFPHLIDEIFGRSAGIPISLKVEGNRYWDKPLEWTPITNIIAPHLRIFRTLDLRFAGVCFSPLFELPPGFVDSLESVKLKLEWGYGDWENFNPFDVDKPVSVFSGARGLRQVEIASSFDHGRWFLLNPDALDLPWAQLSYLRLGPAIALTPVQAHNVLRQSTRLVNCRLDLAPDWNHNSTASVSPLVCHDLESLYLFVINDANMIQFLQPLILPSCKEFACKTESYSCEQTELVSLIRRSECSITSISMVSRRMEVVDEALLEELSSLTTFEGQSLIFTSTVLKRMSPSCGKQLLPRLSVFYAHVDSPDSFVDMLEDQEYASPDHLPKLRVAKVYCNTSVPDAVYGAALERLEKLRRPVVGDSLRMWKAN